MPACASAPLPCRAAVLPPLSLTRAAHSPIRCVTIAAQFVKFRPAQQPIDWRLVLTDTALDLCVPASSALAAFLPAAVRLISAASLTMDGLYTYHGSYGAQCQVRTTTFTVRLFVISFAFSLVCLFVAPCLSAA